MSLVVVVFWGTFILMYTGRYNLLTTPQFGIASAPLAIGAGLYVAVPSWSPLVGHLDQTTSTIGTLVQAAVGPIGSVLEIYIYLVFLAGLGVVIKDTLAGNSLFVGQALALVLGSLVTIVASVLDIVGTPVKGYPVTEVALGGQSLLWGYAVFGQQFLQVVPAVATIGERAVFDELDDAVIVVDDSGTVTRMNPPARSSLDLDEVVGGPVEPLLDRMGVSALADLPTRFQSQGQSYWAKTSRITNWRGEPIGRAVMVQDITSLVRRQQRLEVLNRILRHNVRNDMNVVLGRSNELRERDEEPVTTIGETIHRKADDLLTVSEKAIEVDQVFDEITVRHIHLEAVIGEIVPSLTAQHPDASISTDSTAEELHTDASILSLVLEETLTNALEHSGDNPEVHVDIAPRNDHLEITVTDDGPGIPRTEIDPIIAGEETSLEHASSLGLWLVYWGTSHSAVTWRSLPRRRALR